MANNRRAFELAIANVQKAKDVAALYSWTARTSSGAYLCVPCGAYVHISRGQGACLDLIPWLAQNGDLEYGLRQKFEEKARVHDQSKLHDTCMDLFHESIASPLASFVAARSEHAMLVIENLFKVTLNNARKYRAFLRRSSGYT